MTFSFGIAAKIEAKNIPSKTKGGNEGKKIALNAKKLRSLPLYSFFTTIIRLKFAEMNIATAVQVLAQVETPYLQVAEVVSVQKEQATCAVLLNDGTELPDVRLRPLLYNVGALLIVPKRGSDIVIGFLNKSEAVVLMYSEAEEVIYNEGNNKGLVKIEPLVSEINALKKEINDLKDVLMKWTPAPNDGGLALKTAAATWSAQPLLNVKIGDLENEKIKH